MSINLKEARLKAKAEIKRLLIEGKTYQEIAEAVGCSINTVYLIARNEGLRRSDRHVDMHKEEE